MKKYVFIIFEYIFLIINKFLFKVPGFTRKENGQWLYSTKALELLRNYIQNFPVLFENLGRNAGSEMYFANELFGKEYVFF